MSYQESHTFLLLQRALQQEAKAQELVVELRRVLRRSGLTDADIDDRLAYMT